jgi:AcrR family transcriptional regulator
MELKLRKRKYDSTGRRTHARKAREGIVEIAESMFLRDGYAATTIASIASAAGVSAEMIYKAFRGKPGLVRAIRERGLAGTGTVHAERRSDAMRAEETDPRRIVAQWGVFTAEVAPRVSPILLLIREAAASDPEMAQLMAEIDSDRRRRMAVNARHLRDMRGLRPGVTLQQATDVLWAYSSAELYDLLVVRRRWPAARYGEFVADGIAAALLRRTSA